MFLLIIKRTVFRRFAKSKGNRAAGESWGTLGSPGMHLSLLFPQDLDTPWGSKAMIHPESEPEASSIRKTQLVCLEMPAENDPTDIESFH